jgi:hypothetical protein
MIVGELLNRQRIVAVARPYARAAMESVFGDDLLNRLCQNRFAI